MESLSTIFLHLLLENEEVALIELIFYLHFSGCTRKGSKIGCFTLVL